MLRRYFILLSVGVLLACLSTVYADRTESASEIIEADGAKNVSIDIDFAAGNLEIAADDMSEVARLEVDYSPRQVSYDVDYYTRAETGYLTLESELRKNSIHKNIENDWQLTLSKKYETDLKLEIGACETRMDLGGIPLKELSMEMGAASSVIEFSEPNPVRMKELKIDVGASSLEMTDIGNANVEFLEISCGAASCDLDFNGEFHGETDLDLEVGMGSADITIPEGLAVRVEEDGGFFSSIDFHGVKIREVDDDVWETRDFESATDRLIIRVEVGMGSVDIYSEH